MEEYYAVDGIPFDLTTATRALEILLKDPNLGEVVLVCKKDTIIGYIALTNGYSLEFGGAYQFIDEFFIREQFRRKGAGAATLQFVEQLAKDSNVSMLHLEVEQHNTEAHSFYSKLGFKSQGRHLLVKPIPPNASDINESAQSSARG